MLAFLRDSGKLSQRKARLLAVAACHRIWHLLSNETSRQAVRLAQQYSDGLCCEETLQAAAAKAYDVAMSLAAHAGDSGRSDSAHHAALAAWEAATAGTPQPEEGLIQAAKAIAWEGAVGHYGPDGGLAAEIAESDCQCVLIRDIFGPWPFRGKPTITEGVLAFNDNCVVKLAAGIHEDRDFSQDRMGVLADALEEAGVTDEDVLGHCRQGGVHVHGCWLVDLLTGRE
jgi:hypothetical protein